MEGVIDSLICKDFYSALRSLIKTLSELKVIDGAVFFDKNKNLEILAGFERIKGRSFEDVEGISKSSIEEAEEKKSDFFEDDILVKKGRDSALYYRISSLYVSPFYFNGSLAGILYLDRIDERRRFSQSERVLIRLIRDILEKHIQDLFFDELISKELDGWLGKSDFSMKIRREIKELSSISPILILGETGVGKNLLAELIHKGSGRKGNFVVVSLPSLPETLFEAELFGCKKGAYTGASERKGLVGEAENGTLFFDEISEIPYLLQSKLLRFIETGKYRRLGEERERISDCHIICATNRELWKEVDRGNFRKDLYFRISNRIITIPPLRERKEDIEEIARFYLAKNGIFFEDKALEILINYDYPGNVRELLKILNEVRQRKKKYIKGKDLKEIISNLKISNESDELAKKILNGELSWGEIKELFLKREISREVMRKIIKSLLEKTLKRSYKEVAVLLRTDYGRFMAFLHRHRIL